MQNLTVYVTRWWAGVDNAHYTEKCPGVDSTSLNAANPTSRVHVLLDGLFFQINTKIYGERRSLLISFPILDVEICFSIIQWKRLNCALHSILAQQMMEHKEAKHTSMLGRMSPPPARFHAGFSLQAEATNKLAK
jgi:hypothetical protein